MYFQTVGVFISQKKLFHICHCYFYVICADQQATSTVEGLFIKTTTILWTRGPILWTRGPIRYLGNAIDMES